MTPFVIFKEDIDDFIIVANRLMAKTDTNKTTTKGGKPERIRVTDKTATGGWF